ncbi:hypothetical protein [Pseudomonas sp.]|uniref:hypothetical protein n=1 Tax=Pseudomonas sp. TaxID=306 RepID=UPI003CC52EAF|tara:strand:+ start:2207 stop:2659 length:453 start_codon:yes stop_codon:yes gene_type:complete
MLAYLKTYLTQGELGVNEKQRSLCRYLAKMESAQAAEWLISTYPIDSVDYGEAFWLMSHRSWRRGDQKRLAIYYFKKLPFSGAFGYESFASFMSTSALLSCVRARLPMSHADVELLLYYLVPALKKFAKGQADYQLITDFATEAQNATLG